MTRVAVGAGSIAKRDAPHGIRIEVAKLRAAAAIGEETGTFRVPRVLVAEPGADTFEMERIHGLVGIRRLRAPIERRLDLMDRAGRALAAIHDRLVLPDDLTIDLPLQVGGGDEGLVYLHGDFSGENVCVLGGDRLVILDWQSTPKLGALATRGTPYFDLAWFIGNLYRRPPHLLLQPASIDQCAMAFVAGYAAARDLSRDGLGRYLARLATLRQSVFDQHQPILKRFALRPGFGLWRRLAHQLTNARK